MTPRLRRWSGSKSHPSRGEWIEIGAGWRTPHGTLSHPSRGEWIEIGAGWRTPHGTLSHPSRGEWIEIMRNSQPAASRTGLTPHGVSGLKSTQRRCFAQLRSSHPSRGEWIEIVTNVSTLPLVRGLTPHGVSGLKSGHQQRGRGSCASLTPHGVSGLKCNHGEECGDRRRSHPSRGEWIEIPTKNGAKRPTIVSPLTG